MSKYDPLGAYLRKQPFAEVTMTFGDIERVTGVRLPPKAQTHRAWWSNNASNNVMTRVWLDAGFRSEQVDIAARKLVFRRVSGASSAPAGMAETQRAFRLESVRQSRRHPMFGTLKGTLVIEPGYDLTQPADPELADYLAETYKTGEE